MLRTFSDLPAFRRDPLAFLEARGRSGEALPKLNLGPRPMYLVADPQLARDVLRAEEAAIDKGRHIAKLQQIVGINSLTMSGPEQRTRRAAIHHTFAQGMATDYVPQLGAVVRAWAASIAREKVINAHQTTAHLTLRVICAILFGRDALTPGDESLLIQAVKLIEDDLAADMFRALPPLPWVALRKHRRLRQARRMMSLVVDRTCQRATSVSLLRSLEGLGLDQDSLRDEILLILLAGHHTTGAAAAWALHFIATDPRLASTLQHEAERLSNQDGEITPVALRSASKSRALAFEVLRLYPSTYWMSRDLMCDQVLAGKSLKRGTSLIISQWHMHRDPRFWEDAEVLRLDRQWSANPAYMPFGFGSRACTGMSVASLMLQLIALEFALSFDAKVTTAAPGAPKASVTLVPPAIELRLAARTYEGLAPEVAA